METYIFVLASSVGFIELVWGFIWFFTLKRAVDKKIYGQPLSSLEIVGQAYLWQALIFIPLAVIVNIVN